MKNLKFSLFIALVGSLLLMFSCAKEDLTQLSDLDSPTDFILKSGNPHAGNIIIVAPSGGDDTDLILNAINSTDPGDVVSLTEGVFRINPLYIEDFHGSLVGAGMDKTFVEPFGTLTFPAAQDLLNYPEAGALWPFLITFRSGDFYLGNMTIQVPTGTSISPWSIFGTTYTDLLVGLVLVTGETANSVVEQVGFEGGSGSFIGFNVIQAYYIEGTLIDPYVVSGDHAIYSSSFRNVGWGASLGSFGNVNMKVGGTPSKGNTFEDVAFGIGIYDCSDSQVEISYNTINNPQFYGIEAYAGYYFNFGLFSEPPEISNMVIKHNDITITGVADGALFQDFGPSFSGEKKMNLKFSNNKITMNETSFGGLYANGVEDALIKNNKFTGDALAGIYFENGSGWTILGNNMQNMDATYAAIWLWSTANNNTVVGGSNSTNCVDEGTGNIVTGVNNMAGNPPGPEIMEAMQQQHLLWNHWNFNP